MLESCRSSNHFFYDSFVVEYNSDDQWVELEPDCKLLSFESPTQIRVLEGKRQKKESESEEDKKKKKGKGKDKEKKNKDKSKKKGKGKGDKEEEEDKGKNKEDSNESATQDSPPSSLVPITPTRR